MLALWNRIRNRPKRPEGDTLYRAAMLVAALLILATVAFF